MSRDGHRQHYGVYSGNHGHGAPGTAAIPAVHADRLRAEETGKQAVRIAAAGLSPDKIVSEKSVENAHASWRSGDRRTEIHLTAIAGGAGVRISSAA